MQHHIPAHVRIGFRLALALLPIVSALEGLVGRLFTHARCVRWAVAGALLGLASIAYASPVEQLPPELHPLAAAVQIAGIPGALAYVAYQLGKIAGKLAESLEGFRIPVHIHLTTDATRHDPPTEERPR